MLQSTGERQVGTTLNQIKPDHLERYKFASEYLDEGLTVLDAACGVGYGSYVIAASGHNVLGIDIEPRALDMAKEFYAHDNVKYLVCDISKEQFPFADSRFDAVVSFETIEHVMEAIARRFLTNLSKISDVLLASVPNEEVVPHNYHTHPFHERHYTPEEFIELLESTGWEVEKMYTQHTKNPGLVEPGDDGRTLIAVCKTKR